MLSVIIVDDNPLDIKGLIKNIQWDELNLSVIGTAKNGEEGYELVLQKEPDIIITDVSMPKMSGLEMLKALSDNGKEIRAIIMSCFEEFEFVQEAMRLKAYSYILKPIIIEEMSKNLIAIRDQIIRQKQEDKNKLDLELKMQKNQPVIQKQFIRELLYGKMRSREEIILRANEYKINVLEGKYLLVALQIDSKVSEELNQDEYIKEAYKDIFELSELAADKFKNTYISYTVVINPLEMVTLFVLDENYEEQYDEVIMSLDNIRATVEDTGFYTVTIAIGKVVSDISKLPIELENAKKVLENKFFEGGNRILLSEELSSGGEKLYLEGVDFSETILHLIEEGTKEEIVEFVDGILNKNRIKNKEDARYVCFSIIHFLDTYLRERKNSFEEILNSKDSLLEKLAGFETISGIRRWITKIMDSIREFSASLIDNRWHNTIEDIKNIVDEDYKDIKSLEYIAERVYMSSRYANQVFKEEVGITIFDYLVKVRIENAKKLLTDRNIKVYEVVDAVGYTNKSYFGTLFKQYTGLTPKQYKDKYSN